jgi:type IV pilus assembly protein PilO
MNLANFLEKRKYISVVISVILLALIIGNNLYQFQKRKIAYLKTEIKKEESKNRLVREIVLLNKKIGSYEKRLPRQRDVSWLMRKVTQLAKDAQVKIISLKPQAIDRQVGYVRIPLEIKLNCSYHELGGFLSNIESSPEFIRINSLQLISSTQQISETEEEKSKIGAEDKYKPPAISLVVSTVYLEN